MSDIFKCSGCGAPLQSADKNKSGFVPEHNMCCDDVICRRCFCMKNYNEVRDVGIDREVFSKPLRAPTPRQGIVCHLREVFDYAGTVVYYVKCIAGYNKRS
ncbi:hypothetical protein C7Q42_14055 [Staphylococcus aureus]|nr:hypothetical protein C7Q42_14055 [Staphylococcus aureus]